MNCAPYISKIFDNIQKDYKFHDFIAEFKKTYIIYQFCLVSKMWRVEREGISVTAAGRNFECSSYCSRACV